MPNKTKKKVLMVGPVPPPFGGGMSAYMHTLLESELPKQVNLQVVDTKIPRFFVKQRYFRPLLSLVFLSKILIKLVFFRPEILHVHTSAHIGFWEKSIFIFIGKIMGVKGIFHIHGSGFQEFYNNSANKGRISRSLNRCAAVIALSRQWRIFFEQMVVPDKIAVIENGVLLAPFYHRPLDDGKTRILFAGSMGDRKGLFTLLEAIKGSSRLRETDVEFNMLGGEIFYGDFNRVVTAFTEAGLTNVVFHGVKDGEEKFEFFRQSDIFILPSFEEGLPIAILEAMASSLPIISTTVGGIPDLVLPENGILITAGDDSALRKALEKLVDSSDLCREMGRHNRAKIEAEYSAEAIMKRVLDLYYAV